MGRLHLVYLDGKIYSCKHCRTHLALSEDILSKSYAACCHFVWSIIISCIGKIPSDCAAKKILAVLQPTNEYSAFHCRHGKAYLFNRVVNVSVGEKEERSMTTGMHTVADIFCIGCGAILGWKYLVAHEKSQRYKEGMFILERFKVLGPDGASYWEGHETRAGGRDA